MLRVVTEWLESTSEQDDINMFDVGILLEKIIEEDRAIGRWPKKSKSKIDALVDIVNHDQ